MKVVNRIFVREYYIDIVICQSIDFLTIFLRTNLTEAI